MKFKTIFDKSVSQVKSCSGDRYKSQLQLRILPNGKHDFIEVSKDDMYMQIQSHANSVDIHWILDHFSNNPIGLSERLQKTSGQYLDLVDIPKNFHEMLQLVHDSSEFFYSLPVEIREKFNNSVDQFISSLGTSETIEILKSVSSETKSEFEHLKDKKVSSKDVVSAEPVEEVKE